MQFIEIVGAAYVECGVSGSPPPDVTVATGEGGRIVRWVSEAWRQLQLQNLNWRWMQGTASVGTTIGVGSYLPSAFSGIGGRFRAWRLNSGRCHETALGLADQIPLLYLNYDQFLQSYLTGLVPGGRPLHWTIGPNDAILVGPAPDKVYTLTFDFRRSVQTLVANTDVPELPADYHYALVYAAMIKYARFESASEIYDDAVESYNADVRRLSIEQLEPVELGTQALVE